MNCLFVMENLVWCGGFSVALGYLLSSDLSSLLEFLQVENTYRNNTCIGSIFYIDRVCRYKAIEALRLDQMAWLRYYPLVSNIQLSQMCIFPNSKMQTSIWISNVEITHRSRWSWEDIYLTLVLLKSWICALAHCSICHDDPIVGLVASISYHNKAGLFYDSTAVQWVQSQLYSCCLCCCCLC